MLRPYIIVISLLCFSPRIVIAHLYEFEKIFESTGLTSLGEPVISDSGAISFIEGRGNSLAIYVKNETGLVLRNGIGPDLAHIFEGDDLLDINSNEDIVFLGQELVDQTVLCVRSYISKKTELSLVEKVCNIGISRLSISDSGRVVYEKGEGSNSSIYHGDANSISVILDFAVGNWVLPLQNESETIVALELALEKLVMRLSDGTLITVAQPSDGFCAPRPLSLTDNDVLLFSALDCDTRVKSIFRFAAGQTENLVSGLEPGMQINSVDEAHIDNAGRIIFTANQLDGTHGLFEIEGATVIPILVTGQFLDGMEVVGIKLSRHPFNNQSDTVIQVRSFDPTTFDSIFMNYVVRVESPDPDTPSTFVGNGGGVVDLLLLFVLLIVIIFRALLYRFR